MNRASLLRAGILLVVVAALLVAVRLLPVERHLRDLLEWVRSLGAWGPVALAAIYVVATVLMVPGSLLTLGAGFCFDLVLGCITASLGSTLGATAAFLVGRTLARPFVEARVAGKPKFRALDQAVGDRGFTIVLLTRLSPIFPFNVLNYAFGLTRVRLRSYVLASWLGMMPGTVLYVYLGTLVKELAEVGAESSEERTPRLAFFGLGLLVAAGATAYVTRLARAALARAIPPHSP